MVNTFQLRIRYRESITVTLVFIFLYIQSIFEIQEEKFNYFGVNKYDNFLFIEILYFVHCHYF